MCAGSPRQIEDTTRLWAERLWRRWGRRCRSSNKYFEVFPGRTSWCVASRDLDPSGRPPLLDDPDRPFQSPLTTVLEELADDDGRRDDDAGAGPPHPGDLQAVQPQEVARSALDSVPPVACLAVVASRPGPRQPRNPDAAEPGFPRAPALRSEATRSSGSCRTRPT